MHSLQTCFVNMKTVLLDTYSCKTVQLVCNIDEEFGRISNHVREKREKFMISSDRFGSRDNANTNKFQINTTQQSEVSQGVDGHKSKNTFIDILLEDK